MASVIWGQAQCKLVQRAFFHPATKGSGSIEKVLPAVMQTSEYLKHKYSQPIYGSRDGIQSLNFANQVWWQEKDGTVLDPYQLLPPVLSDLPTRTLATLDSDGEMAIAQGAAAAMAYARLQFEDLPAEERTRIEAALLHYCELDTLAINDGVEYFQQW